MTWGALTWAQGAWSQQSSSGPITAAATNRISAFNFCDPFDHILPFADGIVSALDRQHLWGMYTGIAAAPPVVVPVDERNRGGWLSPEQVAKLRLIAKDAEQRQKDRSRRNKQRVAKRRAELEGIFNEIHGIIPESAAESVAEAVRPFSASTDARVPPPAAIDFKALLDSAEATARLATALARISQERNEDETMILLMMAA